MSTYCTWLPASLGLPIKLLAASSLVNLRTNTTYNRLFAGYQPSPLASPLTGEAPSPATHISRISDSVGDEDEDRAMVDQSPTSQHPPTNVWRSQNGRRRGHNLLGLDVSITSGNYQGETATVVSGANGYYACRLHHNAQSNLIQKRSSELQEIAGVAVRPGRPGRIFKAKSIHAAAVVVNMLPLASSVLRFKRKHREVTHDSRA
jgi:hypothetical protein